jgi:hypothetical protein
MCGSGSNVEMGWEEDEVVFYNRMAALRLVGYKLTTGVNDGVMRR